MRVVLHIGDQKTGSTSIQEMLMRNRSALAERGVLVPAATKSGRYDLGLQAAFSPNPRSMRIYRRSHGLADRAPVLRHMRRELDDELAGGQFDDAVFSFEGLMWMSGDAIVRLRRFLLRFADRIEVVAFLRRQDRKAVSLYATKLMLGRGELRMLPTADGFDYWSALERWRETFGPDDISIHVYEDEPDVAEVFGQHLPEGLMLAAEVPRQNIGVGGKAQEVLKLLRTTYEDRLPPLEEAMRMRQAIRSTIQGGSRPLPPEAEARAFVARFEDGNHRICTEFGLDRSTLFGLRLTSPRRSVLEIPQG